MILNANIVASRKTRTAAMAAVTALLVTACTQQGTESGEAASSSGEENPFGHVHGLALDPGTDQLLLATHNGLFDISGESPEKIGSTNDLMGFATADAGRYYASGHPGSGSDLPNPLGLVESTDGGQTWQELSRQGESDFHALTVSEEGVIGFDGTLRMTADGQEWTEASDQIQPVNLAASTDGPVVLATTEDGVQRSDDGGATWELPESAPVLLITAFADANTAVGVAPDGTVHVSRDAGKSWERTGGTTGQPSAVAASTDGEDGLQIWVATEQGIEFSDDAGATFSTTVPAGQ